MEKKNKKETVDKFEFIQPEIKGGKGAKAKAKTAAKT